MILKTTQEAVIELGTPSSNGKVLLQGNENLNDVLSGVHVTNTNIDNTFLKVFGTDCFFLYSASIFCDSETCDRQEVGVAHLELDEDNIYLYRDSPFYTTHGEQTSPSFNKCMSLDCDGPNERLILTAHYPRAIQELLISDNCLITSNGPHSPAAVVLQKNSILGRLDEDIQSISLEDIPQSPIFKHAIVNAFCSFTKQMKLKTSKLYSKIFSTKSLILESHNNPSNKTGELYFDKDEDRLKFFDGTKWRSFIYEDT